jgi:hypothetical protein
MKTFLKILGLLMGLRLIFSIIFENSSLFVGFVGVGLTVLCAVSLWQQIRRKE